MSKWARSVTAGEDPAAWDESPAPAVRLAETWWLGLRLAEGVDPAEARATAGWEGSDDTDPVLAEIREIARHGHVALDERSDRWVLTESGLPLADAIAGRVLRVAGTSSAPASQPPGDQGGGGVAGAP